VIVLPRAAVKAAFTPVIPRELKTLAPIVVPRPGINIDPIAATLIKSSIIASLLEAPVV
jgi:hypothetical protein